MKFEAFDVKGVCCQENLKVYNVHCVRLRVKNGNCWAYSTALIQRWRIDIMSLIRSSRHCRKLIAGVVRINWPILAWNVLWNRPNHIPKKSISTAIGMSFLKLKDFEIILDIFPWASRAEPDQMTILIALWSGSTLFAYVISKGINGLMLTTTVTYYNTLWPPVRYDVYGSKYTSHTENITCSYKTHSFPNNTMTKTHS